MSFQVEIYFGVEKIVAETEKWTTAKLLAEELTGLGWKATVVEVPTE